MENGGPRPPKFRAYAQQYLLTVPHCDAEPRVVLERAQSLAHFECAVVSREQHGDGDNHLHAVLRFTKRLDIRDPRFFDHLFGGSHANVRAARSFEASVRYVCKDGDYQAVGVDVGAIINKKASRQGMESYTPFPHLSA